MNSLRTMVFALIALTLAGQAWGNDEGTPFGKISQSDYNKLSTLARTHGIDIESEISNVYDKKDGAALGRIFKIALFFEKLDPVTKAYGQVIFSSFLTMSESKDFNYAAVVAAQKPDIQQRIRDFIYYPISQSSGTERIEADKGLRVEAPLLFPVDYVFGHNDPIFKKSD
jgi:hypothetical protein